MRVGLALAALCAVLLAACGSGSSAAPASTRAATSAAAAACPSSSGSSTDVPGAPLRTLLRVPAGNRDRAVPLVLALHFASGDGAQMEALTRLTPIAGPRGFDVAYPTATSNGFWRASDVPKLQATITAIERAACIDRSRVYVLGMSNGGGMAGLAACRLPDVIAASVLFAPGVGLASTGCSLSRPASALEIQGSADPIVPYRDGRAFIGTWARRSGCAASPAVTRPRARVTRLRWRGCDAGVAVEHLRLAGGRHIELFTQLRAAGVDPAATAWRFLAGRRLG